MSWPDSTTLAAERLAGCLDHLAQQHLVDAQVSTDLSARLQAVSEEPESAAQACELIWKHREILVRPLVQQGQLALSRLRIGAGEAWTALPTTLRAVAGAIDSGYAEGWAAMDGQRLWIPDHLLHHAMLDLEVGHLGTWPLFESDPHAQQLFDGHTPPHPFRIWQERPNPWGSGKVKSWSSIFGRRGARLVAKRCPAFRACKDDSPTMACNL